MHKARVLAGTNWVDRGHVIGLALIGCSTVFLAQATLAYFSQGRALARLRATQSWVWLSSLFLSLLVVALGATLLVLLLGLD